MDRKDLSTCAVVGVRICVLSNSGKILLGKRKDNSSYALPGGHLERFETFEECGRRELKEETDLEVEEKAFKLLVINNIYSKEKGYHFLNIILVCPHPQNQEPKNLEPEKCEGWEWWTLDEIELRSAETFNTVQVLLKQKNELFNLNHLKETLQK